MRSARRTADRALDLSRVALGEEVSSEVLAQIIGVTAGRIRQYGPDVLPRGPSGGYIVLAALRALFERQSRVAAGRGGDETAADLTKERALLAREQRRGQELKNAVTLRELLPAQDVERCWADASTVIRNRVLGVVADVAQAIPHLTRADLEEVDRCVRDALEDAHADLAPVESNDESDANAQPD